MHQLVGHTLGPYRIDALLGKGGMGQVFRGYQPALDRAVAIKVLYASMFADPNAEARFRREAQSAARLRHPGIVQVYDFGESGSIFYMVMELIEGGSLGQVLRRLSDTGRYMPLGQVADLIEQVADALDYAHAHGVLHRDIKPDNVMLAEATAQDPQRRVILTDFGLAKIVGDSSLTRTGYFAGTPSYMAPEQCMGQPADARADVYALGVVLYELLLNRVPFDAGNTPQVIYQQIYEPPPHPRDLRPDLPPAAEEVVIQALAKRPEERYATAGALAQNLARALRATPHNGSMPARVTPQGAAHTRVSSPTRPKAPPPIVRPGPTATSVSAPSTVLRHPPKRGRQRRIRAGLTTLVLLLALLAGTAGLTYTLADTIMPPEWAAEVRSFFDTLVQLPGPPAASAQVDSAIGLYLRAGPGIRYPAIDQFDNHTSLTLLEQHNGWFHVRGPQGQEGWVSGDFLKEFSTPREQVSQATTIPSVPPVSFEVVAVRVGTADGQRLRVVVALVGRQGADTRGLFEAPEARPAGDEVMLYVRARSAADLAPRFLNETARELADVAVVQPVGRDGLILRIAPKQPLFLRPTFVTEQEPTRVVVDLCAREDCPALQ